jgi:alkanesulfonate monooxygenase SsuD/methylene tetrahydromethanopterin reductase-like flavin-dependent oxidoreductase (luciferase family)
MSERNSLLTRGNRLKLAMFGANCSSGRSYTTIPERWVASWENNAGLARLADELGIEVMIPIARWKGYGGQTNTNGSSFECITWACGLLAETRRINVFCTVHVPLNHPVVAAKQMATADQIGRGRFGVNLVCGWNEDEFRMFGVTRLEHDARYEQGEEWWAVVRRIWAEEEPFDFAGRHYRFTGVSGSPGPFGGRAPLMMNAGMSPAGRRFAILHSDLHFDAVKTPEDSVARIAETKRLAREQGRAVQVWTPTGVICRPTQREATEYIRYLIEHADLGAMGYLAAQHSPDDQAVSAAGGLLLRHGDEPLERRVLARGAYCVVGDPDHVAGELARLAAAGFDGLALNFVDYLKELPFFAQEVLPRLEGMGLRDRSTSPPPQLTPTPSSPATLTSASQVRSGSGMPSRLRAARLRASGSPGSSTSSKPSAGGIALSRSAMLSTVRSNSSSGRKAFESMHSTNRQLPCSEASSRSPPLRPIAISSTITDMA